jgi:hypothetical protein
MAGEVIYEVHCISCPGLIDRVAQSQAEAVGYEHYATHHPMTPVPAGGGDLWEARVAAPVCEVCWAILEPPYWQHVSTPPTHAGGGRDESGEWLLCDSCHDLHAQGALGRWTQRAFRHTTDRAPWMKSLPADLMLEARAELAGTIRLLLQRLDGGRRISL